MLLECINQHIWVLCTAQRWVAGTCICKVSAGTRTAMHGGVGWTRVELAAGWEQAVLGAG